jgi:cyanophycinase
MQPKGTLLIIGGAEDKGTKKKASPMPVNTKKQEALEILRELLPTKGKKRLEIITTASSKPDDVARTYRYAFKKIGYTDIGFLHLLEKSEGRDPAVCQRLSDAHAVFFSGGDQFRLAATLGGTDCIKTLREKYWDDKDFVLAGTSAGAMVIPSVMIYEGGIKEALFKEDLKTTSGFGIIDTCIVDTHFIKRGRFGRLAHAVIMNSEMLGIGLGEDTALIIRKGHQAECRGSGMVVIIDGKEISYTNITEVDEEDPIYVENLKVHILVKGCKYHLENRLMIEPRHVHKKASK